PRDGCWKFPRITRGNDRDQRHGRNHQPAALATALFLSLNKVQTGVHVNEQREQKIAARTSLTKPRMTRIARMLVNRSAHPCHPRLCQRGSRLKTLCVGPARERTIPFLSE